MNNFAVSYLIYRFFYRIYDFFRHWYVDGSIAIARLFMVTLEDADRSFAVKVTAQHFFEPLYKDYSIIGRILGILFRSFRILIGVAAYAALAVVFLILYLAWIAVPPAFLFFSLWRI